MTSEPVQTPSIDESVHIIPGDSAAASLREVGGGAAIVVHDPHSPGPCDVNPVRHRQKREAYLRGYADRSCQRDPRQNAAYVRMISRYVLNAYDLADRLSKAPEKPVRIWTAPSWHDRLCFWWVLDALKRTRQRLDRFWVAEPAVEEGVKPERMAGFSMGAYAPRCFRDGEAGMCPLDAELLETGASLWRAFAGRSPAVFDLACREGRRHFPDLPRSAEPYSTVFPRVIKQRVMLSELDQVLLNALSTTRWRNLVGMLKSSSRLLDFFGFFGDSFLIRRAREWAQTSAVLMKDSGGDVEPTAFSFRLTKVGERLREQGMASPSEAPELWIGGCRLYGKRPWVRRKRSGRWRFEQ